MYNYIYIYITHGTCNLNCSNIKNKYIYVCTV